MPDSIPLSFIAEFAYCPRSAFWLLTDAPRSRDENVFIQDGRGKHSLVDAGYVRHKNSKRIESSVVVFSEEHGINGKIDVLEFLTPLNPPLSGGKIEIIPVEFKRGKTRENEMHRIQLNLTALCLEEMYPGTVVTKGVVYFTDDRKRHEIEITSESKASAAKIALNVHTAFNGEVDPKNFPMVKDFRCNGCCFYDLCYY